MLKNLNEKSQAIEYSRTQTDVLIQRLNPPSTRRGDPRMYGNVNCPL